MVRPSASFVAKEWFGLREIARGVGPDETFAHDFIEATSGVCRSVLAGFRRR